MDEVAVLWIPGFVTLAVASAAAATDLVSFRVPNALSLPLMASGLLYHAVFTGWHGFAGSVLGMLFGVAILVPPWLAGLMGASDAKLMGGVGAWLGLGGAIVAFAVTALATGLVAVGLIVYRGKFLESARTLKRICYDLAVFHTMAGHEDALKDLSRQPDRRLRVIPFAAMTPIGIVGAIVWMMHR